jgi:hypothetical protein
MALKTRKTPDVMLFGLVHAFNLLVRWIVGSITTYPHADVTSTPGGNYQLPTATALHVTAAAATTLATGITLGEDVRGVTLKHLADGGSAFNAYGGAHKAADATNIALIAYATIAKLTATSTQGQLNTLLNALKTVALAHVSQAGVHFTADATNTVAAADATDLASSETLANALKAWANAHIDFAGSAQTIDLVAA